MPARHHPAIRPPAVLSGSALRTCSARPLSASSSPDPSLPPHRKSLPCLANRRLPFPRSCAVAPRSGRSPPLSACLYATFRGLARERVTHSRRGPTRNQDYRGDFYVELQSCADSHRFDAGDEAPCRPPCSGSSIPVKPRSLCCMWWNPNPASARNGHTMRLMTELELFAHRQFREARISRRIEWGRPADCILNVIRATRAGCRAHVRRACAARR